MILLTLLGFLIILSLQIKNLVKFFYEGNGANVERFSLIAGTMIGIAICIGILFKDFSTIKIAITLGLVTRIILYWPIIKAVTSKLLSK